MSREERVRQLILRHGGKNVSTAIRYLAAELNKHKLQLLAQHNLTNICNCSCHDESVVQSCRERLDDHIEASPVRQRRDSY